MVDAGELDLKKGLQRIEIPMKRDEGYVDVGTYTVVLVTLPEAGEPRREATTSLEVVSGD